MSLIKYQAFKTKLKQLKKAEISSVYLFYGYEDYLKNETIAYIEKMLIDPSAKDLNYSVFHLSDKESSGILIENVLQSANSFPFISDRKLVIVKNINKLPAAQDSSLENYIENPSKTTCLVLVGGDKLPKRAIFAKIGKLFPTVNFYHLYEQDICRWIMEEVKSNKKNISYPAAQTVFNITGENLADIKHEVEKLVLYAGEKSEITVEDVEICCGHFKENTVFELLPALAQKDVNPAIKILTNLYNAGESEFAVISVITDRYKKYLKFHEASYGGLNEATAAAKAGVNFYQREFLKDARSLSIDDIKTSLREILDTELKMKSVQNSKIQVEKLFFELCKKTS